MPEDRYRVRETDPGARARIGAADLSAALIDGNIHHAEGELPSADLKLSTALLAGKRIEYFGQVNLERHPGTGPQFTGSVIRAFSSEGGELLVECQTHPTMREAKVGQLETGQIDFREIVHLMTREGGLSDEMIQIEDFDQLPRELIEVWLPLRGLRVERPVRLGRLTLLAPSVIEPVLTPFEAGEARTSFERAECVALYRSVAARMLDVEQQAVQAAEVVLGWIVTRGRYGSSHLPDGELQSFDRRRALARPQRLPFSIACGLDTGRRWIRKLGLPGPDDPALLGRGEGRWSPPAPEEMPLADQLGAIALRRAVEVSDPIQKSQALFDALEFYVSDVQGAGKFDKAQAKRVRRSVPRDIDPQLRQRAVMLLESLNAAPMMARLREAARRDGARLTEAEIDLLHRVRRTRNRATHGKEAEPPGSAELDHAVSIVSRLLLHAQQRRRSDAA